MADLGARGEGNCLTKNKVNVIIGDWTQTSRNWPGVSASKTITKTSINNYSYEFQKCELSPSESENSDVGSQISVSSSSLSSCCFADSMKSTLTEPNRAPQMYDDNHQAPPINLKQFSKSSASIKVRGPTGSVRGYRDFVRQSARNLHELNEMTLNDQLIYVQSSSLLSRKLLEQEDGEILGDSEKIVDDNDCDVNKKVQLDIGKRRLEIAKTRRVDEEMEVEKVQLPSTLTRAFAQLEDNHDGNNNNEEQANKLLIYSQDRLSDRKRQALRALYLDRLALSERDLCVLYTTSLSVVRRTFDDSKLMRNILSLNLIRFEERDVYLNREYKIQLRLRLMMMATMKGRQRDSGLGGNFARVTQAMSSGGCPSITSLSNHLPCLFVEGRLFCNLKDLEGLNETSRLSEVFARFKLPTYSSNICKCCGNARFIACPNCNGSRRSLVHHFRFSSVSLRCTRCDDNHGLVACPICNLSLNNDNKYYYQDSYVENEPLLED